MADTGVDHLVELLQIVSYMLIRFEGYFCWGRGPDLDIPSDSDAAYVWERTSSYMKLLAFEATRRGWGAESTLFADLYVECGASSAVRPAVPVWSGGSKPSKNPPLARAAARAFFGLHLIRTRAKIKSSGLTSLPKGSRTMMLYHAGRTGH